MNNKFARNMAIFFLRSSRGDGLLARFVNPIRTLLDGTVYLFAIKGLTGYSVPVYVLPIIIIARIIFSPFVAWLDERFLGFWKAENYYLSYGLDPYNQEVLARLKNIENILKKE